MLIKAINRISYIFICKAIIHLLNVEYRNHSPVLFGLLKLFWKKSSGISHFRMVNFDGAALELWPKSQESRFLQRAVVILRENIV